MHDCCIAIILIDYIIDVCVKPNGSADPVTYLAIIDSNEKNITWKAIGLALHIQRDTVERSSEVNLELQVCESPENFTFPEDYEVGSLIYKITVSESLLKDLSISFNHFAEIKSEDDINTVSIAGSTAVSSEQAASLDLFPRHLYTVTKDTCTVHTKELVSGSVVTAVKSNYKGTNSV